MNKKLITALIATGALTSWTFAFGGMWNMVNQAQWMWHRMENNFNWASQAAQAQAEHAREMAAQTSQATSNAMPTPPQPPVMNRKEFKQAKQDLRNKFEQAKEQFKQWLKETRYSFKSWAKLLRTQYRPQIRQAWKSLSADVKSKLKELRREYRPQLQKIREEIKNATWETRKELWTQYRTLVNNLHNQVNEIAANTPFAKDLAAQRAQLQAERQAMLEKIQEERNNFKQVRTQFRDSRQALVVKWKKMIISKLSSRIDKMSLARLEKIETRIDNAVPKLEARKDLSENNKEQIVSALDALKQVVTTRIATLKAQTPSSNNTMNILGSILGN